jgi:hypothetical protein
MRVLIVVSVQILVAIFSTYFGYYKGVAAGRAAAGEVTELRMTKGLPPGEVYGVFRRGYTSLFGADFDRIAILGEIPMPGAGGNIRVYKYVLAGENTYSSELVKK